MRLLRYLFYLFVHHIPIRIQIWLRRVRQIQNILYSLRIFLYLLPLTLTIHMLRFTLQMMKYLSYVCAHTCNDLQCKMQLKMVTFNRTINKLCVRCAWQTFINQSRWGDIPNNLITHLYTCVRPNLGLFFFFFWSSDTHLHTSSHIMQIDDHIHRHYAMHGNRNLLLFFFFG